MNKQFLSSVELSDKMFSLLFAILIFALLVTFVAIIIFLSYRQCREKKNQKSESESTRSRSRRPTTEFVRWVQDTIFPSSGSTMKVNRHSASASASFFHVSRVDANITIKCESEFAKIHEITLQEDNIFDDVQFYEIRSSVSTEFCEDLRTKVKWEEMIKAKILKAPHRSPQDKQMEKKEELKRPLQSNVRRNLLDEFNDPEIESYFTQRMLSTSMFHV